MLRASSSAASASRILWSVTGNIPQTPTRKSYSPGRMSCNLIALASCGLTGRRAVSSKGPIAPKSLPSDVLLEEERIPGYNPHDFFHPNPGDVLDHRYEMKAKIGWGTSSTVWLAQDIRR